MPPAAAWNRPILSWLAPVKAALDVAEQFAFHQLRRNGATVHRNESARGPGAVVVDESGHHLLAAAGFAVYVHRRLAAGQLGNLLAQLLDAWARTNEILVYGVIRLAGVALQLQRVVTSLRSVSSSMGLLMKSKAPAFSAEMAASTLPWAVIMATGIWGNPAVCIPPG